MDTLSSCVQFAKAAKLNLGFMIFFFFLLSGIYGAKNCIEPTWAKAEGRFRIFNKYVRRSPNTL